MFDISRRNPTGQEAAPSALVPDQGTRSRPLIAPSPGQTAAPMTPLSAGQEAVLRFRRTRSRPAIRFRRANCRPFGFEDKKPSSTLRGGPSAIDSLPRSASGKGLSTANGDKGPSPPQRPAQTQAKPENKRALPFFRWGSGVCINFQISKISKIFRVADLGTSPYYCQMKSRLWIGNRSRPSLSGVYAAISCGLIRAFRFGKGTRPSVGRVVDDRVALAVSRPGRMGRETNAPLLE